MELQHAEHPPPPTTAAVAQVLKFLLYHVIKCPFWKGYTAVSTSLMSQVNSQHTVHPGVMSSE